MPIKNLKPAKVWEYFYDICQIPHVSYDLDKITSYLEKTFIELGYTPIVDKAQNILVRKPASKGCEKLPTVMLQGHSDMVGAKDPSSTHDFKKDPIKIKVVNGWMSADKTTLGADNGIAVAMILAIFADKTLKHGPIEALITANEETGMDGIKEFNVKQLKSKYMINLDNENDEEICIGCPGNIDITAELPYKRDARTRPNTTDLRIFLSGGLGGHSGQAIGEKRINAIKTIFDLLNFLNNDHDIQLINIEKSGVVKNVIPFECACNINVYKKDVAKIKKFTSWWLKTLKQEFSRETDLVISVTPSKVKDHPITKKDSQKIIGVYGSVFNGVDTYSWKYSVPETSGNLGLIDTKKDAIWSLFMVRSSYDLAQHRIANRIMQLFKGVGGDAQQIAFVAGWLPKDNKLADIYETFYKKVFKKEAKQVLINGGVEPAYVLAQRPEMLGISIGPLMHDVHSKNERLSIESTQKVYEVLTKFLPTVR